MLLILVFGSVSTFGVVPTDLKIEGLNGNVQFIEDETAVLKIKNGVSKSDSRFRSLTIKFDKKGRMTYKWEKIGNVSPFENFYSYEKDKRFTRSLRSNLPVSDKIYENLTFSIFTYDSVENALIEEVFAESANKGKVKIRGLKFGFDKDGRISEETYYSADGEAIFLTKYTYIEGQQLPVEKRIGDALNFNDVQIFKYTYELDPQGNWTKRTAEVSIKDGKELRPTEITYRKIKYYN